MRASVAASYPVATVGNLLTCAGLTPDLTPPLCDLCFLKHVWGRGGGLGSIGHLHKWT